MKAHLALLLAASALAACAPAGEASQTQKPSAATPVSTPKPGGAWSLAPAGDLNAFFDCLEHEGATLVSAHRGGPAPGFPENAIETMQATLAGAPALIELDVATSADGVLYLMHDDTLDRTTAGQGRADGLPFADIAALFLVDPKGKPTPYHPPRFEDVLRFAKSRTILQIDFKRTTRFEPVIAAIRAAGIGNRVILISYSLGMAQKLHRLAPEMMISYETKSPADLDAARAGGLPADRLLAFTGAEAPEPSLFAALRRARVEVIFATLGRNGVDAALAATGADDQYAALSREGVDILATDRPLAAERALDAAGRAAKPGQCGVSQR